MPNHVIINDGNEQELFTASNPALVQVGAGSAVIGEVDIKDQALTRLCDTIVLVGPTELAAAPGAGLRIVVSVFVVQNTTAVATTIKLQAGASDVWRPLCQNQGDGLAAQFPVGREWKLPENTALNIELSGANSCSYSIGYYTESTS